MSCKEAPGALNGRTAYEKETEGECRETFCFFMRENMNIIQGVGVAASSHVWMVPTGIPNSLAALAPPISLAGFTACTFIDVR